MNEAGFILRGALITTQVSPSQVEKKIEQRLKAIEAVVALEGDSVAKPLALYLHQLHLLSEIGVLERRRTDVFNLFSGLDFYPLHFANRMFTLDNRLSSDSIGKGMSEIRQKLSAHLPDDDSFKLGSDFFPLPANSNRERDVVHSEMDVFTKGLGAAWKGHVEKSRNPVFFLKQVLQYGEAFNTPGHMPQLFKELTELMPARSLAVVIENPEAGSRALADQFAKDQRFDDVMPSLLKGLLLPRLNTLNDKMTYTHSRLNVDGEFFQVMLAGRLSVFAKK